MSTYYNHMELNAPYYFIPGGKFKYSVTGQEVAVPDFHLAKYPTTNKLYRRFISFLAGKKTEASLCDLSLEQFAQSLLIKAKETNGFVDYLGHDPGQWANKLRSNYDDEKRFNDDEQPVVGVTWFAATAYCHWLSELQRASSNQQSATNLFRLPTEVEWEWAATGGVRKYPWGNEPPDASRANYDDRVGQTTPVGSYPDGATPEGLMDMAGNVWEWCENLYGHKEYKEYKDARALRGGSWYYGTGNLQCAFRARLSPVDAVDLVCFRVACASSPNLLRL